MAVPDNVHLVKSFILHLAFFTEKSEAIMNGILQFTHIYFISIIYMYKLYIYIKSFSLYVFIYIILQYIYIYLSITVPLSFLFLSQFSFILSKGDTSTYTANSLILSLFQGLVLLVMSTFFCISKLFSAAPWFPCLSSSPDSDILQNHPTCQNNLYDYKDLNPD